MEEQLIWLFKAAFGMFFRRTTFFGRRTTVFVRRMVLWLPAGVVVTIGAPHAGLPILFRVVMVPLSTFAIMLGCGTVAVGVMRMISAVWAPIAFPFRGVLWLADALWLLEAGIEPAAEQFDATERGLEHEYRREALRSFAESAERGKLSLASETFSHAGEAWGHVRLDNGRLVGDREGTTEAIGAVQRMGNEYQVKDAEGHVLMKFDARGLSPDGKVVAYPDGTDRDDWMQASAPVPELPSPGRFRFGPMQQTLAAILVLAASLGLGALVLEIDPPTHVGGTRASTGTLAEPGAPRTAGATQTRGTPPGTPDQHAALAATGSPTGLVPTSTKATPTRAPTTSRRPPTLGAALTETHHWSVTTARVGQVAAYALPCTTGNGTFTCNDRCGTNSGTMQASPDGSQVTLVFLKLCGRTKHLKLVYPVASFTPTRFRLERTRDFQEWVLDEH